MKRVEKVPTHVREEVLNKSGDLCSLCGDSQVDIYPVHQTGVDVCNADELVALCEACASMIDLENVSYYKRNPWSETQKASG